MYSRAQLKELIEKAAQLGFWEDVMHWKSELAKMEQGMKEEQ